MQKQIPLDYLISELGFANKAECIAFVKSHGLVIKGENVIPKQ